jgi:hypothetical protein
MRMFMSVDMNMRMSTAITLMSMTMGASTAKSSQLRMMAERIQAI